jgi:PadR family transcriptional regulator, regulatory protein PadR
MMPDKESQCSFEGESCPCGGGTLDKLVQPAILIVLSEGPLHGYGLAERLSQMPMFGGQKPDGSGIYRFLKTMESKGLVASSWDTTQSGPARRAYEITPAGEGCLRTWVRTLESYRDGINSLLRAARKSTVK